MDLDGSHQLKITVQLSMNTKFIGETRALAFKTTILCLETKKAQILFQEDIKSKEISMIHNYNLLSLNLSKVA